MEVRSRVTLDMIKSLRQRMPLQYFFQCGPEEKTNDRNNNGVIDVIDVTLYLIHELQLKGYSYPGDICYKEIEGGKYDLSTWGSALPRFIKWAFLKDGIRPL